MSQEIFDFNKSSDLSGWMIVDDVVMGGRSSGVFRLDKDGHGVFEGEVSLENNGGFSSVRYDFANMQVNENEKINIRLRGDGKDYQFRIKSTASDYVSFVKSFTTTGKWEEIEIELKEMYPSFRGRILDQPNFSSDSFESITFLIGNKKQENFQLIIDNIYLK
ncbi:MAG: CIA30 family protein [Flavobacteriales bacterium]|jgi:NADH dehydrogenase [ubiquinone] 1 alpha subcomplex assembly factor 1|tara:strand:- start:169 stop:657 length:489 start_codon:yes stop_codon:yes gene_type:complete